ncbi:MAG: hypothetical protein ABEJ66_00105 [Candidatus Nanohaloarchaea archaeon]
MRMQGQYLAIESVLTFGLGLVVAIGTVSAFSSYRSQVMDQATARQVDVIESRISQALQTLDDVDSGSLRIELPKEVGSSEYIVAFGRESLRITVENGERYTTDLEQFNYYSFQGSTGGGAVKVFKRGDQFILRAD